MLRVVICGTSIDLPPKPSITFVYENPFLLQDRIPVPASLNFEIPPTPKNLLLFGNPNRLTAKLDITDKEVKVYFGPIIIFEGVAVFNGYSKAIKLMLRGATFSNLQKPLSSLLMHKYVIAQGNRWNSGEAKTGGWGDVYEDLVMSQLNGAGDWVCVPIRCGEGTSTQENYLNYGHEFGFYSSEVTTGIDEDGGFMTSYGLHSATYPFPRIGYVIDCIFGNALISNPFNNGDLRKVLMTTSYHKDYPGIIGNWKLGYYFLDNKMVQFSEELQNEELSFSINSFMPDYNSAAFVKNILKIFGYTCFSTNRKFDIKHNSAILNGTKVVSWTNKLVGEPSSTVDSKKLFTLEIGGNGNSEKEENPYRVENIADILNDDSWVEGSKTFFINSTGEIWEVTKTHVAATSSAEYNFEFELKDSGLSGSTVVADDDKITKYSVSSDISPVEMTCEAYMSSWGADGVGNLERMWYIPTIDDNRKLNTNIPKLLLYGGMVNNVKKVSYHNYVPYAFGSNHNVDMHGRKFCDFSLHIGGQDGLINKFHFDYKAWIERDKRKLDATMCLSAIDIRNLDMSLKYEIKNRHYFTEKVTVTVNFDSIDDARVSLVEA